MVVSVKFHGAQQASISIDRVDVLLGEGGRVRDVFHDIRKRYPELPLTEEEVVISVNNRIVSMDQELNHADDISFLPHIGGG